MFGEILESVCLIAREDFDQAKEEPAGVPQLPAPTPIKFKDAAVFPIGLYALPKHPAGHDMFPELAAQGFDLLLLPPTATQEQLDAAKASNIRVMLTLHDLLNLSGTPEQIAEKKKRIAELVGPESVAFKHEAVVALEGPDEPLWLAKRKQLERDGTPQDLATWVRTAEQASEIDTLLHGLREGYAEVRRLCNDRYQIWLNFAPRGDADELRWFTGLPVVGGFAQDKRTTADVFGTDVYPIPDGRGSNGWIDGRILESAAAVGMFTEKLRRAVHPHPFYMVLQGCGALEWDAQAVAEGRTLRRPTLAEQQFMAFDAIVHGAGGLMIWGAQHIDRGSMYWRHIGVVNRQVRALSPVLTEGEPWPDARPGEQQVRVRGFVYQNERYVIVTNNDHYNPVQGWIAVPGWSGDTAYSLLDGRSVKVSSYVIKEPIPPLTARVYADSPSLFERFGYPKPEVLAQRPRRLLFGWPEKGPFEGKDPAQAASLLTKAGVDGVVKLPSDPKIVDALHKVNIKAYAEIACFSGKEAWEQFPGARPVTADGKPWEDNEGYGGLCLNDHDYRRDLFNRIEQLLGEAKWDGLWLDYIRWPGQWEKNEPALTRLCFNDACLETFTQDRGVHYPKDLSTNQQKAAWILAYHEATWTAWKCDRVADVVEQIREKVRRKLGPDAVLGIFGVPMREADFNGAVRRTFGQDWATLAPFVDVFSPMVYHIYCGRPLEWINQVTAEVSQRSGRTLWPIVQSCSVPTEMTVAEFENALRHGLKPPATGVMISATRFTIEENTWEHTARVFNGVGAKPATPKKK